ncbi:hypothetical protein BAZ10_11875 [Elizabethkingia occulta]|uniref:mannosyl-glycoprotein endo-beta-N-acetylglucosaminidase n=2 Tax=Elizabethkingia occulta TaxID=1867263 RepID=A0A1T3M972_9FLAO|nr:hypothetical protein BAZ10_11875 [Elizabethkingia occulta]
MFNCSSDLREESVVSDKKALALNAAVGGSAEFANLIAYKNSPHQLHGAYYRTWRDIATESTNKTAMTALPDSLDFVMVFNADTPPSSAYWQTLKNTYIPYLHARGTKVIYTLGIDGIKSSFNNNKYSRDKNGYAQFAKDVMRDYVDLYNYDGIDIDFETSFPNQQEINLLQGVYNALSVYLGPQSGTSKWLILDTNQSHKSYFTSLYPKINYLFLQVYGQSTSSIQNYYTAYNGGGLTSNKILPGFSFREERGSNWGDVSYPDVNSDYCYKMAKWNPTQGQKGGTFSYAVDRDFSGSYTDNLVTPDYHVTRKIISILNPLLTSSAITSGATYQLVSAVNNTSVLDVEGGATANSTKTLLWGNAGSDNQKWIITSTGNGYYRLSPKHAPNLALDVAGGAASNGTQVQIYQSNGTNAQKWKITSVGNGYFTLSPANAASSNLDVNEGSSSNGTKIQIYTANSGNAQKWKLVKL